MTYELRDADERCLALGLDGLGFASAVVGPDGVRVRSEHVWREPDVAAMLREFLPVLRAALRQPECVWSIAQAARYVDVSLPVPDPPRRSIVTVLGSDDGREVVAEALRRQG